MLCITSSLITTTTFTMDADKQSQENPKEPATPDLEQVFGVNVNNVKHKLNISAENNPKLNYSFYAALDNGWLVSMEEWLEQCAEARARQHQGMITVNGKQIIQNDISQNKNEEKK
jgi:hypothetical protein